LFGALSSAIIVYGISLSYGLTGSTNIGEVIQGYSTLDPSLLPLALLSVGLFIAGFGFKMGLIPFHQWLPDTMKVHLHQLLHFLQQQPKKLDLLQRLEL